LAGLASDNQQRTTSACAERMGNVPHFFAGKYAIGTSGGVSVTGGIFHA